MAVTVYNLPSKLLHAARIEFGALKIIATHGVPDTILQFLGGIGDELLLTAVARELKRRNKNADIWQVSHSASLLHHNPDYSQVFDFDHWELRYAMLLKKQRIQLRYSTEIIPGELEIAPDEHIIARLCRNAGIVGPVDLRPYLYLTQEEKTHGAIAKHFLAVQNIGVSTHETFMNNKKWYPERMQQLVNVLQKTNVARTIVQLGGGSDIALENVLDLRGKTTLRESAAIIANAQLFIGTSGFLKHLARAVDIRSVIIYGGREHSYQTGYLCNENINTVVECSPCWRWNLCDYNKKCMDAISVDAVFAAIERALERIRQPLETESCVIE
jgi:ADP-heptose:LPS heptosyltransferase